MTDQSVDELVVDCWVCRERANLAGQLKDTKTVVGRLEGVIGLVLHILAFFIYLVIFDVRKCLLQDYSAHLLPRHTASLLATCMRIIELVTGQTLVM